MKYRVSHIIRVDYEPPIRAAHFNLRLRPVDWPSQSIVDFDMQIDPRPERQQELPGAYPLNLTRVEIGQPISVLEISTTFLADVGDMRLDITAPDLSISEVAQAARAQARLDDLAPANYLFPSLLLPHVVEIADWARPMLPSDSPCLESALALAKTIQQTFKYDKDATEADTPVERAFAMKRGVCQDFAHILIVALRAVGLPAAYVSGYLRTYPPPGQPRLVGADAMHAWVALWCGPQRGWVGVDPTNGCLANADHLVVAIGRDFADVSPLDGIFVGAGTQRIEASVDVAALND